MNPIRVLVVDDSAVARGLITRALLVHSEVNVVGAAANGVIALSKLAQLSPDAILLDIDMPEMDGITTLRQIRKDHPKLPVIMFSSRSERGAMITVEALAAGASDYALKPSAKDGGNIEDVVANILLPKLVALARPGQAPVTMKAGLGARTSSPPAPRSNPPVTSPVAAAPLGLVRMTPQVVAIASSTGGPNALSEMFSQLPGKLPVPIVIAQHMPPVFTRCLAERLAERTQNRVIESQGEELLEPGTVYVAPGDFHLELAREAGGVRTKLTSAPPENSCRPAADVLFRSVARVYGPSALCVVLTGMGSDGMLGAREVVQAGGRVLAQSGPSCVVWGMPKAVEEAGLCEAIVPLSEMAMAINQRVSAAWRAGRMQSGS